MRCVCGWDNPDGKTERRERSGAERLRTARLEVGGSGGQGVNAQGAVRPSRGAFGEGVPIRATVDGRRSSSTPLTERCLCPADPSVQYPAYYAALGVRRVGSRAVEPLYVENRGKRGCRP